jgi:cell division protein FtsB
MGRNRKNGPAGWLVAAVKATLICGLIGGSAVGYVYQKQQLIALGREIQKSEQQLKSLAEINARLTRTLLTLQSPRYLEERAKELKLGLVQPAQSQILTLTEVPAGALIAPRSQPLYAENQMGRTIRK